jgi:SAM-dependent methyltransferase
MKKSVKELHQNRSKMWDAAMENHNKYINQETGLFSSAYTEQRTCPVCDSNDYVIMFNKAGGTYVKCGVCTMVYLNPAFSDESLKTYYNNNHTEQSEVVELDEDSFYSKLYNLGLDSIIQAKPDVKSILDIGCSSGVFLDIANKKELKTFGIELNRSEYLFAKNKGHHVYNDLLEDIEFKNKFDAISMWDVFEHLKDGRFYLNLLKSILTDDGIVFLQIPSADALAAKILQEKCNMFDGLEHVNLYGVATIKTLAESCGFEVCGFRSVIAEIGVINNYLNYDDPYLGNTKNREFIPDLLSETQIHERCLGYKLQVVLKKSFK